MQFIFRAYVLFVQRSAEKQRETKNAGQVEAGNVGSVFRGCNKIALMQKFEITIFASRYVYDELREITLKTKDRQQ